MKVFSLVLVLLLNTLCVRGGAQEATSVSAEDVPLSVRGEEQQEIPVQVYLSLMDSKSVADIYGTRVAKAFVAWRISIRNMYQQKRIVIHNFTLDLSQVRPKFAEMTVTPYSVGYPGSSEPVPLVQSQCVVNTILPQQTSRVVPVFLPQSLLMDKGKQTCFGTSLVLASRDLAWRRSRL